MNARLMAALAGAGAVGCFLAAPVGLVGQANAGAQLVTDAADAMGGRERVLAVRSLVIEGYGRNPNIGQQMRPESEPLLWMLPDYVRRYDFENARYGVEFTRRPAFPAVFDNFGFAGRLDGTVAFGGRGRGGGPPARQPDTTARERRLESFHHPLAALRAALAPGARLGPVRTTGTDRSVDVTTASGDTFTLAIDALNRPLSVTTRHAHPNLGDIERTTQFGAYENLDGLRLPKRLVTYLDRWVEYDIGVMKHTLDAPVPDMAAPDEVRAAPPAPEPGPPTLEAAAVAPGIWFVTGGGVPSLVVEFADHLTLVEVPNEAKVQALLALAAQLVPDKPVTQAVVSHHHFDHTAGLRAAVAAGLEIVTHRVNAAWFEELVARPFTLAPDGLARAPRPLALTLVDDALTLADASMEMVLYHLRASTHGDGLLAAYFPRERIYAEADVWNPGAQIQPHLGSLADDIERRRLAIERVLPLHGNAPQPWPALAADIAAWRTRRETAMEGVR